MSAASRTTHSIATAAGRKMSRDAARSGGFHTTSIVSIEVAWSLARSAVNGEAPGGVSRMLEMKLLVQALNGGSPSVSVTLADAKTGERAVLHRQAVASGEVIPDIRGQVHIEVPGWLHATIGAGRVGDAWRLVYARTPLLEKLGVPGGRAEPVGVRVTTA